MLNLQRRDRGPGAGFGESAYAPLASGQAEGARAAARSILTAAQLAQLETFARGLTREQALWVSGYFAGVGGTVGHGEAQAAAAIATAAVTVLYGSETGNSARLAERFAARLRVEGLSVRVSDMNDYKVRQLKDEHFLFIITSTHGEGDPPQSALNFFEFVEGRKAPRLPGLKYGVLALGDSTYEKYCEAGRRIDRRLEELGATRVGARIDCDVDFEEPSEAWMDIVQPFLATQQQHKASNSPVLSVVSSPSAASAPIVDRRNPFHAPIIDNLVLTGRGSSKETRHIEFSLAGSNLSYEPGDALGLLPANGIDVVDAILAQTGLDGEAAVSVKRGEVSLAQALTFDFEIMAAAPRFLEAWARLSGAAELRRLASPENSAERNAFLHRHHVIDIVRAFPVSGVSATDFLAGLRPMQPRLYSIASSLAAAPDEAHLTVATIRYELNGEQRCGVASGHTIAGAGPDAVLPVYVQSNPNFRLPADDVPIVMIGAGTGIAPFRAFLQEREARGATGQSWLFFGDRNFRSDFLYQLEWQEHLRSGLLARMDVAFSRDQAGKVYVQDKLTEKAADLFAWLQVGAHLYVCGDAAHMAPDVHAALLSIIRTHGRLGPDAAEDYLRTLQRDHRYQRDVY